MASGTVFNTNVADIQTDLTVTGRQITGTSKWLASGDIADYWGAGNFIYLKFTLPQGVSYSNVKVGLEPSAGSGLVTLDADLDGVFKVTNKDTQNFVVVANISGTEYKEEYNLGGLTCLEA